MAHAAPDTRKQRLSAALERFAEQGCAGTSVQPIADPARVIPPTLGSWYSSSAGGAG
jgi:hypothetical protein